MTSFFAKYDRKTTESESVYCGKSVEDNESFNQSIHSFIDKKTIKRAQNERQLNTFSLTKNIEDFRQAVEVVSLRQLSYYDKYCRKSCGWASDLCSNSHCDVFWRKRMAKEAAMRVLKGKRQLRLVFET